MRAIVMSGLLAAALNTSSTTMGSTPAAPEPVAAVMSSISTDVAQPSVPQRAFAAIAGTQASAETIGVVRTTSPAADGTRAVVSEASTAASPAPAEAPSTTVATMTGQAPMGLTLAHGERSQLEAYKQLLTLQLDIAVLQRKLFEVEHGAPGPSDAPTVRASLPSPAEPPPRVLSRLGFDGRYSAVLQMHGGGQLTVQPGDVLPHGKVEHIEAQGVTATWYGRRIRLLDAVLEAPGANDSSRGLSLALPSPPLTVSQP